MENYTIKLDKNAKLGDDEFLVNMLKDKINHSDGFNILIDAGTGLGKSYLMGLLSKYTSSTFLIAFPTTDSADGLYKDLIDPEGPFKLTKSDVKLSRMPKSDESAKEIKTLTNTIKDSIVIPKIIVTTHAQLNLVDIEALSALGDDSVLVLDEVHVLVTDISWKYKNILRMLEMLNSSSINKIIGLTGTSSALKSLTKNIAPKWNYKYTITQDQTKIFHNINRINYYNDSNKLKNIENDKLDRAINAHVTGKISSIYHSKSKKEQNVIREALENLGFSVLVVNADTKDTKDHLSVIENSKIPEGYDFFIFNAVMREGFSIKNKNIGNLTLFHDVPKEEFKQVVARFREPENDEMNITFFTTEVEKKYGEEKNNEERRKTAENEAYNRNKVSEYVTTVKARDYGKAVSIDPDTSRWKVDELLLSNRNYMAQAVGQGFNPFSLFSRAEQLKASELNIGISDQSQMCSESYGLVDIRKDLKAKIEQETYYMLSDMKDYIKDILARLDNPVQYLKDFKEYAISRNYNEVDVRKMEQIYRSGSGRLASYRIDANTSDEALDYYLDIATDKDYRAEEEIRLCWDSLKDSPIEKDKMIYEIANYKFERVYKDKKYTYEEWREMIKIFEALYEMTKIDAYEYRVGERKELGSDVLNEDERNKLKMIMLNTRLLNGEQDEKEIKMFGKKIKDKEEFDEYEIYQKKQKSKLSNERYEQMMKEL